VCAEACEASATGLAGLPLALPVSEKHIKILILNKIYSAHTISIKIQIKSLFPKERDLPSTNSGVPHLSKTSQISYVSMAVWTDVGLRRNIAIAFNAIFPRCLVMGLVVTMRTGNLVEVYAAAIDIAWRRL
jgi:hypothetical protein